MPPRFRPPPAPDPALQQDPSTDPTWVQSALAALYSRQGQAMGASAWNNARQQIANVANSQGPGLHDALLGNVQPQGIPPQGQQPVLSVATGTGEDQKIGFTPQLSAVGQFLQQKYATQRPVGWGVYGNTPTVGGVVPQGWQQAAANGVSPQDFAAQTAAAQTAQRTALNMAVARQMMEADPQYQQLPGYQQQAALLYATGQTDRDFAAQQQTNKVNSDANIEAAKRIQLQDQSLQTSQLANQQTQQAIDQANALNPLKQQEAQNTLGAGYLTQENELAKGAGGQLDNILGSLGYRDLVMDPKTQVYRETQPGETATLPNQLSHYVPTHIDPGDPTNGIPAKSVPGGFQDITPQAAQSIQSLANQRNQVMGTNAQPYTMPISSAYQQQAFASGMGAFQNLQSTMGMGGSPSMGLSPMGALRARQAQLQAGASTQSYPSAGAPSAPPQPPMQTAAYAQTVLPSAYNYAKSVASPVYNFMQNFGAGFNARAQNAGAFAENYGVAAPFNFAAGLLGADNNPMQYITPQSAGIYDPSTGKFQGATPSGYSDYLP